MIGHRDEFTFLYSNMRGSFDETHIAGVAHGYANVKSSRMNQMYLGYKLI
jgi:hypothetical protein